jgi:hypothetical protein
VFSDASLNPVLPWAFYLGTWLGFPRLRVAKFSAQSSAVEIAALRVRNELDIELFEYARNLTGAQWRSYSSYGAFFGDHIALFAAIFAGVALLVLGTLWTCTKLCSCAIATARRYSD